MGQGSTFTIRLPAEVVDPKTAPKLSADDLRARVFPVPKGAATVLVIDDDPTVQDLMQRFLSKEGWRVAIAANGEEGLRLAKALQPNLVTLADKTWEASMQMSMKPRDLCSVRKIRALPERPTYTNWCYPVSF